jgi:MFS family permease
VPDHEDPGVAQLPSSRRVITVYVTTTVIFTLAASVIWGVNTLFLMNSGGLDIFQVMLVNSAYTVGQLVFEVPTGVVADTIGRRASLMLASFTLMIATLLYVASAQYEWGVWAFVGASILLGLGFTFQTGAADAWLVDALDHTGYDHPKDRVFAWGGMSFGIAMIVGTLAGGFLGQVNLSIPYVVRAVLLGVCLIVTGVLVRDLGFQPRELKVSSFGAETRKILHTGVQYGWRHPVVRPLMWVSFASGVFFLFGFYVWQRYALDLLGKEYVWVIGVLTASASLAGVLGNSLVRRIMREGETRRNPARVLAVSSALMTGLLVCIGLVGLVAPNPGLAPFAIASLLWLGFNAIFGITTPVRQAYLNEQIPSAQRATVLSLDAFFSDGGGAVGQPSLGWLAKAASIPIAWLVGSAFMGATVPLYARAGAAEKQLRKTTAEASETDVSA